MNRRTKIYFLLLVIVQGLHSLEEYLGRLWENFPPAAFLTSLISENQETGFLIANISLFSMGILCWLFPILGNYAIARTILWFWILIETLNGIIHPLWSVIQKGYTPGVATAPVLLLIAILLFREMNRKQLNLS